MPDNVTYREMRDSLHDRDNKITGLLHGLEEKIDQLKDCFNTQNIRLEIATNFVKSQEDLNTSNNRVMNEIIDKKLDKSTFVIVTSVLLTMMGGLLMYLYSANEKISVILVDQQVIKGILQNYNISINK